MRISSSAVYSGEPSHAFARSVLSNSRSAIRFGAQSPSMTSIPPPRTMKSAAVTINGRRHLLNKLPIESRVRYLNISYHVCRHRSTILRRILPSFELWRQYTLPSIS